MRKEPEYFAAAAELLEMIIGNYFDVFLAAVSFISMFILFFALIKISKHSTTSAYKYFAISIGVMLLTIIIIFLFFVSIFVIPDIFYTYQNYNGIIGSVFFNISSFVVAITFLIGAIKLRKHANAL